MKKLYVMTSLLLTISISGFGQYNNYKLENYVNPTYKRKALDLGFSTAGNFQKTTTNESNNYGGSLSADYKSIANSEKIQEQTQLSLMGTASHSSIDNSKATNALTSFSVDRQAFHFMDNKLFFEISPNGYVNYNYAKTKSTQNIDTPPYSYTAEDKTNKFQALVAIKLGIGKGRIENVTDARQAVYILEELSKKGIIKQTLTDEEVNAFAEQISLVKNKRSFDPRLALIDEISVIDSFLVANKYIEKDNSAIYFTSLYDKWMYGDRDLRESGSYFKAGINPMYNYSDYRINGNSSNSNIFSASLYLDYRNEKPLDLKWQRSIYAGISSGYQKISFIDDGSINSSIQASYALSYYMNTRTYVQGKVSQSLTWDRYSGNPKQDILFSYTYVGVNAYYYLSPQLRLFGSVGLDYQFQRYTQHNDNLHDKYPHTTFNFGLTYALF